MAALPIVLPPPKATKLLVAVEAAPTDTPALHRWNSDLRPFLRPWSYYSWLRWRVYQSIVRPNHLKVSVDGQYPVVKLSVDQGGGSWSCLYRVCLSRSHYTLLIAEENISTARIAVSGIISKEGVVVSGGDWRSRQDTQGTCCNPQRCC